MQGTSQNPRIPLDIKTFQDVQNESIVVFSPFEDVIAVAAKENLQKGDGRLKVQLKSGLNRLTCTALIDSGSTANVISLSLLKEYNLTQKIEYGDHERFASGFDGRKSRIIGSISLPLVTDTKTNVFRFDVVENLGRFKAILGVGYLDKLGIMASIKDTLENNRVQIKN